MEYINKMLSEQKEERNRDLQRASLNAIAAIPPELRNTAYTTDLRCYFHAINITSLAIFTSHMSF